ncbi:Hypothetical predicted protein [Olea europaea subsp. europaea]|uniref:Uncharacterized protein n=1 Tax=Olea europaea subsp. europaea TaxID=158383 RepID=A0A8S0R897_OLEEU|nr:Hypothetical predicted protein [Olea europaea subsp. europaea]
MEAKIDVDVDVGIEHLNDGEEDDAPIVGENDEPATDEPNAFPVENLNDATPACENKELAAVPNKFPQTEQRVGYGIEQNVKERNVNAPPIHVNSEPHTYSAPPLVDENVELPVEDPVVPSAA